VFPGAEVHLSPGLPEAAQNRRLMTFNNGFRYLLLELPGFGIPSEIVDFIWKIKISGIIPVLAHPERNETLQANIDLIQRMVQQEALVQITAASLEGNFGRRTKRCAETLLARNLVHLIASDAHSAKGGRPPILSRARFLAADLTTPQKAGQMVKATPEKILNGETIRFEEPIIEKPRKKSFFNFF
jgi:protein-tyrosine phosphatase